MSEGESQGHGKGGIKKGHSYPSKLIYNPR